MKTDQPANKTEYLCPFNCSFKLFSVCNPNGDTKYYERGCHSHTTKEPRALNKEQCYLIKDEMKVLVNDKGSTNNRTNNRT